MTTIQSEASASCGIPVGVGLPHYGAETSPEVVRRFAIRAEELGLASLWVIERVLRPVHSAELPMGLGMEVPELYATVLSPLETLVHVAAATTRIRLGTSAVNALFHTPAILGRRLATVDHICGGRLTVSLGQGYLPQEFVAANVPLSRRGRGFDEFVAALRAVWGPDPVQFDGEFYRVPRSEIGPKPTQSDLPLLMGVTSVAASERAGRLGMGINPATSTWELLETQISAFRKAARGAGHDETRLPVIVRGTLQDEGGPVQLGHRDPDTGELIRAPLNGTHSELKDDIRRLESLGVDEVSFDMTSGGYSISRQFDTLAMLATL